MIEGFVEQKCPHKSIMAGKRSIFLYLYLADCSEDDDNCTSDEDDEAQSSNTAGNETFYLFLGTIRLIVNKSVQNNELIKSVPRVRRRAENYFYSVYPRSASL
jgi:hypothetical protein